MLQHRGDDQVFLVRQMAQEPFEQPVRVGGVETSAARRAASPPSASAATSLWPLSAEAMSFSWMISWSFSRRSKPTTIRSSSARNRGNI